MITPLGLKELESALISDRVGFVVDRISLMSYRASFDPDTYVGELPVNVSLFPESAFSEALEAMKGAFQAGLCVSDLVALACSGEKLGGITVREAEMGWATVSSVATGA
ncbi:MAG: NrpR regulatory domain-containing protein, partial [Chloroflexi bacterium]|nr:NrpR regulatory domain-containing protein [Chloroflexota bacterium]